MWLRGGGIVAFTGILLACGGLTTSGPPPLPPPPPEAVELEQIERAASANPDRIRAPSEREARERAIGLWLQVTPDFADWKGAVVDCLRGGACADLPVEAAYAKVKGDFAPKPPLAISVPARDWAAVVIVSHAYDTSEDWAAFTAEVRQAFDGVAPVVELERGQTALSVTPARGEAVEVDVTPHLTDEVLVGYLAVRSGASGATWIDHGMASDVIAKLEGATGKCPKAGCTAVADAAPTSPTSRSTSPTPEPPAPEPVAVAPAPAPVVDEELPEDLDGLLPEPAPSDERGKKKKGR